MPYRILPSKTHEFIVVRLTRDAVDYTECSSLAEAYGVAYTYQYIPEEFTEVIIGYKQAWIWYRSKIPFIFHEIYKNGKWSEWKIETEL
jgi:Zn-dependent M28 family amino/carboxypeptidase